MVVLFALAVTACQESVASRYELHRESASVAFGDDQRIAVAVSPGRARSPDGRTEIFVHASAPWPRLRVANGTVGTQTLSLSIDNADPNGTIVARQRALSLAGRRDVRCSDASFANQATLLVAPPALTGEPAVTLRTGELELPGCTELELQWQPADELSQLRLGVLGGARGDVTDLRAGVAAARAAGADVVAILGGVVKRGGDAEATRAELAAAGIPYIVALSPADARRGSRSFLRAFGQPDWYVQVGSTGWWLLDTADGALADAQFRFISAEDGRAPGVLLTSVPPFASLEPQRWRSTQQANRLAALLRARGVEHVIADAQAGPDERVWSGFALQSLRRIATRRDLVLLTFNDIWSDTPTVAVTRTTW